MSQSVPFKPEVESENGKMLMEFLEEVIPDEMDLYHAMCFWARVITSTAGVMNEKFLILSGTGKNGKTTILRLIEEVLHMNRQNSVRLNPNVFEKIEYLMRTDTRFLNRNSLAFVEIPPQNPISQDIVEYFSGDQLFFGQTSKKINCCFCIETNWNFRNEDPRVTFGDKARLVKCPNMFRGILSYYSFVTNKKIIEEMHQLLMKYYGHLNNH